ncbi:erythromycin esterase family protein [Amycolatopsis cihanbeyliensis]|uniref:Erythromycin esterase n=1 Tax=Amycolatopsis cihanbeyliensis TaxID=1128664 RepID=A0A542CTX7_AMYCI|nr:erythromycin esterase family protein [Amycolatopsis cihanbeyliensis]TQI94276.1 erythromycin esterase [Amycolatopsis cihanbeyliensis]
MRFAEWVKQKAFTADTIDPAAPLDDLEPLGELIGDARVVAIGESAHHAREFYLLRHRLLRFLVERHGFTRYAFEAPYVESEPLDRWTRGGPGELDALTGTPGMALAHCRDMHDTLAWLRGHNATARRSVRFTGTLAQELPALERFGEYLRVADPDALPLLNRALTSARRFHQRSLAQAPHDHTAADQPERDALAAAVSRLLARMESMSSGNTPEWKRAMTYLRSAWLAEHQYRDLVGHGLALGSTSLDAFMAESVLRTLDREPGTRIVLALHNVHLRTTPVEHTGPSGLFPAGYHLRAALGEDYVAIAATGNHGRVICGEPDPAEPTGIALTERPLPEPVPGSVEAAFTDEAALTIADLRAARRDIEDAEAVRAFRHQEDFLDVPVLEALDAVAYIPYLNPTESLGIR